MPGYAHTCTDTVALRKESVDRNYRTIVAFQHSPVALRKESVDRNKRFAISTHCFDVALRKESVDRNQNHQIPVKGICLSLSARRAWIEIGKSCTQAVPLTVALRKESVDRNLWC